MAEYCTPRDLTVLGILGDALEGIPVTDQKTAIKSASDLIDSYLRSQFTLPLASFGNEIRRAAAIIASYDLMAGRGLNPEFGGDSQLRLRYEDILKWLEQIAKGTTTPDVVPGDEEDPGARGGGAQVISNVQRGYQGAGGLAFAGRR